MNYEKHIKSIRENGSKTYFALNTLTNKELLCALNLRDSNTAIENLAISEEMLSRMG